MPRSAGLDSGRSAAADSGASAAGAIAAYAAAIVAFAYALVSLYWAVGGRGLVGTVGGFVEQIARRGGAAVVLLALVAVAAKAVGGLIALALVRPWGRVVRCRLLLIVSAAASVLLIVYGGLNVAAGALVLSGVLHPSGSVNRMALRWHVGVWDLWFLVWGSCWGWQRPATGGRARKAAAQGDRGAQAMAPAALVSFACRKTLDPVAARKDPALVGRTGRRGRRSHAIC